MRPQTIIIWSGILATVFSTSNSVSNMTFSRTATSISIPGSISTTYVFISGNPPSSTPSSVAATNTERHISKALGSSSYAVVATATSSVTEVVSTAVTSTLYPCSSPFPSLIPTLPYGDAAVPSGISTENFLFPVSTTSEGTSAQACCNACFFELAYCIQAYWYSYEGCVVSLANNASLIGRTSEVGASMSCPSGIIEDLTYERDQHAAFRSTGNIAGPCGQIYNNI